MGKLKKFFESTGGRITLTVVVLIAAVIIFSQLRGFFGKSEAAAMSDDRIFVCSETGKSFHVSLDALVGHVGPVHSPYSGKDTGYPSELCYWTADGKVKSEPTAVLLNSTIGKPEPTFCPDCGRLVIGHNPLAKQGAKPPPTRAEYEAAHKHN